MYSERSLNVPLTPPPPQVETSQVLKERLLMATHYMGGRKWQPLRSVPAPRPPPGGGKKKTPSAGPQEVDLEQMEDDMATAELEQFLCAFVNQVCSRTLNPNTLHPKTLCNECVACDLCVDRCVTDPQGISQLWDKVIDSNPTLNPKP
jgi:hypothetical protein